MYPKLSAATDYVQHVYIDRL